MKKINASSISPIYSGVIGIVLGIIMLIWPSQVLDSIMLIIGSFLLLIGLIPIVFEFFRSRSIPLMSVVFIVGGLLVLIFQHQFLSAIMWIFGLILILGAIQQFNAVSIAKRNGYKPDSSSYLFICILLLIGVITFFNPFSSLKILVQFFGVSMIFYGITFLISEIKIRNHN